VSIILPAADSPKAIRPSWESLIEYLITTIFSSTFIFGYFFLKASENTACNKYMSAVFFESVKYLKKSLSIQMYICYRQVSIYQTDHTFSGKMTISSLKSPTHTQTKSNKYIIPTINN